MPECTCVSCGIYLIQVDSTRPSTICSWAIVYAENLNFVDITVHQSIFRFIHLFLARKTGAICDMQPSVEGAYELVLHNDPGVARHRLLSCNYPNSQDWHTKDLFKPHPAKPNLWRYHGRTDDILVFSNGGKFSPIAAEALIQSHPSLAGAIIVGTARSQAALIIEPKAALDSAEGAHLVEQVWPTVAKSNLQSPTQGRILRSMIAVAPPEKSFARAGKGTVVRHLVTSAYATKINQLYAAVEA